jgi:TRAP-type C4-dicarboxylate transport system permease small subunit
MSTGATPPARPAFHRVLDLLGAACSVLTGTALVVLTLIFGWLVYGRYVLNATPTWVEQVSLLLVAYITFLGAALGIHESTHLGVSYFRDIARPGLRRCFTWVSHLVMAVFGMVMMFAGYQLTVFKWGAQIPLIHVPEGVRAIPVMLCGGLIVLFSVGHLMLMLKGISDEPTLTE